MLGPMWVMLDAEVPEATVDKILGHRGGVREGYYRPDLATKLAVLTLFNEKLYPELYLGVRTARSHRRKTSG